MTDHRDPVLQTLFDHDKACHGGQDAEAFTARVMAKTWKVWYWLAAIFGGVALVFLIAVWMVDIPAQDVARRMTHTFGTPLFEFGDGWIAWALAPVNNIAGLLVLSAKVMRVAWKKVFRASY